MFLGRLGLGRREFEEEEGGGAKKCRGIGLFGT